MEMKRLLRCQNISDEDKSLEEERTYLKTNIAKNM